MQSLKYVNAYEVSREYGGPEEGGWWYDAGQPLASVPVRSDQERDAAQHRLRELFSPEFREHRTRYSVIGDSNLEIYVQDHVAAPYPATRPYYE